MTLNRFGFWFLVATQWFSAFAHNAIFFALVAMFTEQGVTAPDEYMTNVQMAFLAAYVLLAPIAGTIADRYPKVWVLRLGNLFKALGVGALLIGAHPALGYALFGVGAVLYSPAKYGLLTELIPDGQALLKGNGIMEGLSILAIMGGTIVGGWMADQSAAWGLIGTLVVIAISISLTVPIPSIPGNRDLRVRESVIQFKADLIFLFKDPMLRFAMFGNASFWMIGQVLRLAYLSWMPLVLGLTSKTDQAAIFAGSGFGVVAGALLAPQLIRFGAAHKAIPYAYLVVLTVVVTPLMTEVWLTGVNLFIMGFFGGMFVVPMNTLLQAEGARTIGVGRTTAIQNMVENAVILAGVGLYTFFTMLGMDLNWRMISVGLTMGVIVFIMRLMMDMKKMKAVAQD